MKSGLKRTINWNKYQSEALIQIRKQYSDYLIDPHFQGVKIPFILSFEENVDQSRHQGCFLPKVEIKDYNVIIDGQNVFDQPVKNDLRTYDKVQNNY